MTLKPVKTYLGQFLRIFTVDNTLFIWKSIPIIRVLKKENITEQISV